jgi:hypothetical protein
VEQKSETINFSVRKLVLDSVKIKEEDIVVKFGDLATLEGNHLKSLCANDDVSCVGWIQGEVLMITTNNISCKVQKLDWEFEQIDFPYLNGAGFGKVDLADAQIYISFKVDQAGSEPKLVVETATLSIETLEFSIQESWLSPLYNSLLWLVEVQS